jgi:hypothetical protein
MKPFGQVTVERVAIIPPDEPKDLDTLKEEAAQSLKKVHALVDGLKSVQEYESTVLRDTNHEPPLFIADK